MDRSSLKIRYSYSNTANSFNFVRDDVLKTLVTFARKTGEFLETKLFRYRFDTKFRNYTHVENYILYIIHCTEKTSRIK